MACAARAPFLLPVVAAAAAMAARVPLIIDTDIGGGGCMDVDDVGAVCMANALADNGEAELLAVVANTGPPHGVGVLSVLNSYYGRADVPVGAYKGGGLNESQFLPYTTDLVTNWPSPIKNASQVVSSVELYRKVLAAQLDGSVVISSVGLLTNLALLLQSAPDAHSPLSGPDLLSRKARLLAVMGGEYPGGGAEPEGCNFCGCAFGDAASVETAVAASAAFFSLLPPGVRVVYVGMSLGRRVQTGARLSACAPRRNPCRQAYIDYGGGPGRGRYSWDLLATLAAVRGPLAAGCAECADCDGVNSIDSATGVNKWIFGKPSNQSFLVLRHAQLAGDTIDELLCQAPKHGPASYDEF